jgi:hypothetical protein
MSVAGGGFLIFGLLYLAVVLGAIVAVVLAVWSLVRGANALDRIAAALEKRPPS